MKLLTAFLICFGHLAMAFDRSSSFDRRILRRSAIKLRSNTGESDGSCSSDSCTSTQTIIYSVIFSILGLICAIYLISACFEEYQEKKKKKEKKARKKLEMAEQLKVQTSVYLAEKMRARSNSVSTTASLDLGR